MLYWGNHPHFLAHFLRDAAGMAAVQYEHDLVTLGNGNLGESCIQLSVCNISDK